MSDEKKLETGEELSPICRRAFLRKVRNVGFGAVAVGAVVSTGSGCFIPAPTPASGGGAATSGGNCGYCNGDGRDYSHCDGAYCNYVNYADG
jgi:hypothetical protein